MAHGDSTDHVIISDLNPARRHYFELVFDPESQTPERLMVAERELPLKSVVNFRDLGGYLTEDGRRVRWGQVYRSGALGHLSQEDADYLQNLGLRLVCDLRTPKEAEANPDQLSFKPTPTYIHKPMYSGNNSSQRLQTLFYNSEQLYAMMVQAYTEHMVDANGETFGDILRRLADKNNLPAVIHCTAGKDRTGIAGAVLLMLLGVPDEIIVADYSLSNAHYLHFADVVRPALRKVAPLGITVEDLQPLLTAPPDTMRRTLSHIREQYGTAEAYVKDKAGLTDEEIAALKANLLEPA